MRALPVLSIAVAAALLLTGLTVLAADHTAQGSVLTRFGSEDELRAFLERHANRATSEDTVGYATAEAASHSDTNAQVEGVDEGDMVKTDGSLIYVAQGNVVHVVGTSPELHNVSELAVGSSGEGNYTAIDGLYLWEGRLVVVATTYEYRALQPEPLRDGAAMMCFPYWSTQRTAAFVYDVRDPLSPAFLCSGGVTGYHSTSRMVGGTLYLVTQQDVWGGEEVCLPAVSVNGTIDGVDATAISYDPACPEVTFFVNLLAMDVSSGEANSLTALAGPASVVYMSETALYLAMPHWTRSSGWPFASTPSSASTDIYRVDVEGTSLALAAQGTVDGTVLNQFALDERDGRLRVATTTASSETSSAVYVLDRGLEEVGSLMGIAPGERIYSSRFIEDRLFLVTFRQVDPLFVIDLATDTPSLLGELKVPGASTYLQVVDEGLLGIGFENGSVKVSLYNVTDPRNPSEVGNYVVEGVSYSTAQYDHHAVLYDPRHDIVVIPVTYYGGWSSDGWAYYRSWSSALVLGVGPGGIHKVGSVLHENATVERSLYIGDTLYTVSDTTVRANSLPSLSATGKLVYSDGGSYHYGWCGPAEPVMVD